jgi:orotidine-5'-phosphate decarboxylase
VLTSVRSDDLVEAGYREHYTKDLRRLVMKKAALAKKAGCAGIVCSGQEVQAVKTELGREFQAVTPGIRPAGGMVAADDQARVVTPAMAIQSGSDYLVIGRPIRDADDPVAAARAIADEIREGLNR